VDFAREPWAKLFWGTILDQGDRQLLGSETIR